MWYDNPWISMPLFCIVTIAVYAAGLLIRKITGKQWLHPLAISIFMVLLLLLLFDIPFEVYETSTTPFHILLGLCVVSFGWLFYDQINFIKENYRFLLASSMVGSLVSMAVISLFFSLTDAPNEVVVSVLPKHTLAPFAVALSGSESGIPGLSVLLVMLTGLLGAVITPLLPNKLTEFAKSLAIGCSCPSCELSTLKGVISGVIAGFSGSVSALLFPVYINLFHC